MVFFKALWEIYLLMESSMQIMMAFLPCAVIVLALLHRFMKEKHEKLWCLLCVIPFVMFLGFYFANSIVGDPALTLERYVFLGVIAFCILLWGGAVLLKRSFKEYLTLTSLLTAAGLVLHIILISISSTVIYAGNHSHDGWTKSFSRTIDDLEKTYVLRDWKSIDFDALRNTYLPVVAEAEKNQDKVAYYTALYNLKYDLYDGHIMIHAADADASRDAMSRLAGYDYGFTMFRDCGGAMLAVMVDEGSEAFRQGIHNGTVITEWDGVPVEEAAASVRCVDSYYDFVCIENEDIFRPIFLAGQGDDAITVTYLNEAGNDQTVTLKAQGDYLDKRTQAIQKIYAVPTERAGNFQTCMLDAHTGYLRITRERYNEEPLKQIQCILDGYSKELYTDLGQQLDALRSQGMERLIIDVRNNVGGRGALSKSVIGLFTEEAQPNDLGWYRNGAYHALTAPARYGDGAYKDLPIILIVNGETCSAGDCLTYFLQQQTDVIIAGNTSTWCSGQGIGGKSILSGGDISINYPIILTPDTDGLPAVDPKADRHSRIHLDEWFTYDRDEVLALFSDASEDHDMILEKALERFDQR